MTESQHEEFWKGMERLRRMDERVAERQRALEQSLELLARDVRELTHKVRRDSEKIRALARIADRRLRRIETP